MLALLSAVLSIIELIFQITLICMGIMVIKVCKVYLKNNPKL